MTGKRGVKSEIFVGRKAELNTLQELFQLKGPNFEPLTVILEGDPGIGKTKLLERFAQGCKGIDLVWAQCEATEGGYDPWVQILKTLVSLHGIQPKHYTLYQTILARLLPSKTPSKTTDIEPEALRERLAELLFSWASARPLILIIEDLYHASSSTINCLRVLARNIALSTPEQKGLGLIVTTRTGEDTPGNIWVKQAISSGIARIIRLAPLKGDEISRYLKHALSGKIQDEIVDEITRLTGGNPLFIDVMVRNLVEEGKIYYRDGCWTTRQRGWEIPQQLGSLIQRRLFFLRPLEREIINMMGVINRPVTPYIIAKLVKGDIKGGLKQLSEGGFVELDRVFKGYPYYRLKHGMLRRAVYEALTPAKRSGLHNCVAAALAQIYEGRLEEALEEIGTHAILGRNKPMIKRYVPLALKSAERRFAWEKVIEYQEAYLETLGKGIDQQRLEATLTLAKAYSNLGEYDRVIKICQDILTQPDKIEPRDRLKLMNLRLGMLVKLLRLKEAQEYATSIKLAVPNWRDYPEGLDLIATQCDLAYALNDPQMQLELAREGLKISKEWNNYLRFDFSLILALAYLYTGRVQEAKEISGQTAQVAATEGRPLDLFNSHLLAGRAYLFSGELDHAERSFKEAYSISHKLARKDGYIMSCCNLGYLHAARGNYKEALRILKDAQRVADVTDNPWWKIAVYRAIGYIHHRIGDLLGARHLFEIAARVSRETAAFVSDRYEIYCELGLIKVEEGQPEAATTLFEEAQRDAQGASVEMYSRISGEIFLLKSHILTKRLDLARDKISEIERTFSGYLQVYRPLRSDFLILKAAFARMQNEPLLAQRLYQEALSLSEEIGIPILQAEAMLGLTESLTQANMVQEAREVSEKTYTLLQRLTQSIPPELEQTFCTSPLWRRVQQLLEPGHISRNIEQELLLMGRMEAMLQRLMETAELIPSEHLFLESSVELSRASGGLLLLRQEFIDDPNLRPLGSIRIEAHRVDLFCVSQTGPKIPSTDSISKDLITRSLTANKDILEGGILYVPLDVSGRRIGQVILSIQRTPDEITHKVLMLFMVRGALILDRLCTIKRLKAQYLLGQRPGPSPTKHEREIRFMQMGIIGGSEPMQRVYELVEKVAPISIPVLLEGETGTGKELIARAIHSLSPRSNRPFLAINCAAVPETLLDSELFGYVRGAFTGADRDHPGLFESARGGTLFLDEITEMSDGMQKKLLRTIEDHQVRRVGGTHPVQVDVRIIGATNQDIRQAVRERRFREDLFHRLNIVIISLPPLRERTQDIPLLVAYILDKIAQDKGLTIEIDPLAVRRLQAYSWPGNVRELENILMHFAVLGKNRIGPADVEFDISEERGADLEYLCSKGLKEIESELEDIRKAHERTVLLRIIQQEHRDIPAICRRLKVPRSTLYRRLKELGIKGPDLRI
jgi:transcriptional regulator with GAF, ATPase, and Fis domain